MNDAHIRQAIQGAQKLVAEKPVYLDTETTGTHKAAEIVEICIVDHDGEVLLDSFVKPQGFIPIQATQVHGITNQMVRGAPTWREIWPKVQGNLTGRKVGIYNANFDLRLIKQSHAQCGMDWGAIGASAFCIMKLYARFYGEKNAHNRAFRWQSLEKAGEQCGVALLNTHRAKADTLLARAVMMYMAEHKT
ncbi:MAG: exonuclease domain-containing protein [Ardenticatenaceae bacterium]